MAEPRIETWTRDDFLALAARPECEKCELFEGALVAMAPERADHAGVKAPVWLSLKRAIDAAHSPCQAFVDGLSVVIDEQTAFVPDAPVNCGEPVAPDSLVAPQSGVSPPSPVAPPVRRSAWRCCTHPREESANSRK